VKPARPTSWLLPTRRLAFVAFAVAAIAVGDAFVPGVRPAVFAIDALVVVLAIVDALFVLGPRLEFDRQTAEIFSLGRPNPVVLHVRSRAWSTLARTRRGTIADDPLESCSESGSRAPFAGAAGESASVRYEITPTRRGPRAFGAVTARYRSPLGLLLRQDRAPVAGRVEVYPDVHAARALELLRRQGRENTFAGSLRARGGDTEFETLRPYRHGDEVRHVDWRASARRDDLTVREFRTESNQNVLMALDVGRAMRGESDGISTLDRALNAALLMADVALRAGDRAGLMAFDDQTRCFVAPASGPAAGRKLAHAAYALEAGLVATDYRSAMTMLRTRIRARSLFVVFTHLLDARAASELADAVRGLLPQHVPLCVLLRDPEIESLALQPPRAIRDVYVRAAAAETLAWRDVLVRQLQRIGALVLDTTPEELTPSLVKTYLDVKTRRIL
jgi:uncharacterized protein (DUF58 family)